MRNRRCEWQDGAMICICTWHPKTKEEVMTEFDPSKPVMTRDARPARIICNDRKDSNGGSEYPLVALIVDDGGESVYLYRSDGRWVIDISRNDLVNIPESKWMNLYEDPESARIASIWHKSQYDADCSALVNHEARGGKRVGLVEWTASGDFITTKVEK